MILVFGNWGPWMQVLYYTRLCDQFHGNRSQLSALSTTHVCYSFSCELVDNTKFASFYIPNVVCVRFAYSTYSLAIE